MTSAPGVGRRTARGALWAYGSYASGRLISLAVTAALARLLVPEDFGLVALALVFLALLETLADIGLNQALILADEAEVEERAETVLVVAIGAAAAMALLTWAAAPLLAEFFSEPELRRILPVLGLTLVIRAAGGTHYALVQKRLDFRTRTIAELGDVLVRAAVSLALALSGAGPWSLVLGAVAGVTAMTSLLWLLVPWRPTWRPQRKHLRGMVRFGVPLTGVNLLAAVIANVDYVAVGRALGTGPLGIYTIGFKLPELLILNLSVVASHVLFPAFTGSSTGELGRRMMSSLHYCLVVCFPVAAVLAAVARPLTLVVFGQTWEPAVPVMQVLTVYALAVTVGIPSGTVHKAMGRADVLFKLACPRAVLAVTLVILALPYGLVAVAAAQAVVAVLFAAAGMGLAFRATRTPLRSLSAACLPPVLAGSAAGACAAAVVALVPTPVGQLLLGGSAALVVYALLLWVLAPGSVRTLVGYARRQTTSPPPP